MGVLNRLERIIVWTLEHTKTRKEDSLITRSLEKTLSVVTYPIIGALPGDIQQREAYIAKVDPVKITYYSIGYTALIGGVKYFTGEQLDDYQATGLIANILQIWAVAGNWIGSLIRTSYTFLTKKPIGLLTIEVAYKINPCKVEVKYSKSSKI